MEWPRHSYASFCVLLVGVGLMFWGQLIADTIGILLIVSAGVALIVTCWTQNATKKKQQRRRRYQRGASIVLVLVALTFAAYQTVVHWRLKQNPPARLRITKFELHPLVSGMPARVNVYFQNDGPETIELQGYYKVFVAEGIPKDTAELRTLEEELWSKYVKPDGFAPKLSVPRGMNQYVTIESSALTPNQATAFQNGRGALLLFMGTHLWKDSTSHGQHDWCAYTQGDPRVIFMCQRHNGESVG